MCCKQATRGSENRANSIRIFYLFLRIYHDIYFRKIGNLESELVKNNCLLTLTSYRGRDNIGSQKVAAHQTLLVGHMGEHFRRKIPELKPCKAGILSVETRLEAIYLVQPRAIKL